MADLAAAKAAADLLDANELRELRAWIDLRLADGDEVSEVRDQSKLSVREMEVLRQLALGYTNKEIAARMDLSAKTVETYKSRAMEKLHIYTRVQLVRYATEQGWFNNI